MDEIMTNLLINTPEGQQEIIEVGEGGKYFDDSRVLWDERIHGPMPSGIRLGGMEAQDVGGVRTLKFNATLFAAANAAQQKEDQDKADRIKKNQDRRASARALLQDLKTPANQAKLQAAIVVLLKELLQSELSNAEL